MLNNNEIYWKSILNINVNIRNIKNERKKINKIVMKSIKIVGTTSWKFWNEILIYPKWARSLIGFFKVIEMLLILMVASFDIFFFSPLFCERFNLHCYDLIFLSFISVWLSCICNLSWNAYARVSSVMHDC